MEAVHEGKKPFKCDVCCKKFSQATSLKIHVQGVHEGKKPFECNVCSKKFAQKGNLKTHMANYHGVEKAKLCKINGTCDLAKIHKRKKDKMTEKNAKHGKNITKKKRDSSENIKDIKQTTFDSGIPQNEDGSNDVSKEVQLLITLRIV